MPDDLDTCIQEIIALTNEECREKHCMQRRELSFAKQQALIHLNNDYHGVNVSNSESESDFRVIQLQEQVRAYWSMILERDDLLDEQQQKLLRMAEELNRRHMICRNALIKQQQDEARFKHRLVQEVRQLLSEVHNLSTDMSQEIATPRLSQRHIILAAPNRENGNQDPVQRLVCDDQNIEIRIEDCNSTYANSDHTHFSSVSDWDPANMRDINPDAVHDEISCCSPPSSTCPATFPCAERPMSRLHGRRPPHVESMAVPSFLSPLLAFTKPSGPPPLPSVFSSPDQYVKVTEPIASAVSIAGSHFCGGTTPALASTEAGRDRKENIFGVGLVLESRDENRSCVRHLVCAVLLGSPAADCLQISKGDVIHAVDGVSISGWDLMRVRQALQEVNLELSIACSSITVSDEDARNRSPYMKQSRRMLAVSIPTLMSERSESEPGRQKVRGHRHVLVLLAESRVGEVNPGEYMIQFSGLPGAGGVPYHASTGPTARRVRLRRRLSSTRIAALGPPAAVAPVRVCTGAIPSAENTVISPTAVMYEDCTKMPQALAAAALLTLSTSSTPRQLEATLPLPLPSIPESESLRGASDAAHVPSGQGSSQLSARRLLVL